MELVVNQELNWRRNDLESNLQNVREYVQGVLKGALPSLDCLGLAMALSYLSIEYMEEGNSIQTDNFIAVVVEGEVQDDSNMSVFGEHSVLALDRLYKCRRRGRLVKVYWDVLHPNFVRILGVGTYGIAELFTFGRFGKAVVKRLKHSSNTMYETVLAREIQNQSKVNSPFVIKLLATVKSNSLPCSNGFDSLVLEYAAKGNLLGLLTEAYETISDHDKIIHAAGILQGIAAVHAHRIVLRDIKAENILIDEHGRVKLSDFGLSKCLEVDERTFTVCGTAQYMAPEVYRGTGYGLKCDIWSAGCVLNELFFGLTEADTDVRSDHLDSFSSRRHPAGSFLQPLMNMDAAFSDLVSALLNEDESKRWSAPESLLHPLFNDVKFMA